MIAETLTGKGYISQFHDFSQIRQTDPAWLTALHREGYTQFAETGFPTTHDEDWRFTNVSAVAQTRFALPAGEGAGATRADLAQFDVSQFACCLVFGRPDGSRSDHFNSCWSRSDQPTRDMHLSS